MSEPDKEKIQEIKKALQAQKSELDRPLPSFRQDLQLFQGPDEPDGSPTFSVFDPVKNQYYKISWSESLILKFFQPGMSIKDLCKVINTRSTLKVTPDEIKAYFQDAARHNLLVHPRPSEHINAEADSRKINPLMWMIFHYLYIRIPLCDPNEFLKKTIKYVRPLASKFALTLYFILTCLGLTLLVGRFDEFIHTFPYFFSTKGLVVYALALTAVKIIHELSHAYTAVHFGVRVPSMGIALLILWPVLFTDVTDGWKLVKRYNRLAISVAGIVVELIIAGLCTLGWALSPPGLVQSVFFVISSASWISTLLVNSNPAMRFDGYYILSDLWGIDNLQSRSFAIARWKLRQVLLGFNLPPPERGLSVKRIRGMVVYSIYTWIYRLFLYTAIALFVYTSFTKVLGLLLFSLEIGVFIIMPLTSEATTLFKLRGYFRYNIRSTLVSATFAILFFWLVIPYPHTESFPAITTPTQQQVVYVPYNGIISKIFVEKGSRVQKGDPLIVLTSEKIQTDIKKLLVEEEIIHRKIKILSLKEHNLPFIPEKEQELRAIMAQRKGLQAKLDELTIKADLNGTVYNLDETLQENQAVSQDKVIGKIANLSKTSIVCFIPESLIHIVDIGQHVTFQLRNNHEEFEGTIEHITPTRARKLNYPALASIYNGDLPISKDASGQLILVESYYPVKISVDTNDLKYGQLGNIYAKGPVKSKASMMMKYLLGLFWRESGV